MTTTGPTLTLVELLERAAVSVVERDAQSDAYRMALATFLRAAATRLREEMEFAEQKRSDFARANNAVSTRAWDLTIAALRSVNGGPANTGSGK